MSECYQVAEQLTDELYLGVALNSSQGQDESVTKYLSDLGSVAVKLRGSTDLGEALNSSLT